MNTMVTTLPFLARPLTTPVPAQPPAAPPAAAPTHDEPFDITVGQAFSALGGAVVAAGIEGVGHTASCIMHTPRGLFNAYKALWNTNEIGPVIKSTIACALPFCAVALPVIATVGSVGYGLFQGFAEGLHEGSVRSAAEKAVHTVKDFDHSAGDLVKRVGEYEARPLSPGEQPFDIKPLEGVRAIAAGATCAIMDGVAGGLITAARTPQGVAKVYKEIWTNDDQGPVLKTTESLLVPAAAVLATPLVAAGGLLYGLVLGCKDGYTEGFGAAVTRSSDNIREYEKMTREAVRWNRSDA